MSSQPDNDLFGVGASLPRPGWVLLDALRDRRFTGELMFESNPTVRVYADRGDIYFAEREGDVSVGARLVDVGVLRAAELEHGALRVGRVEHLGRLFERVPTLDRHTILLAVELMTEECVGWIASQTIARATATPYRHHPSGLHQWRRVGAESRPGDPLPAPTADGTPMAGVALERSLDEAGAARPAPNLVTPEPAITEPIAGSTVDAEPVAAQPTPDFTGGPDDDFDDVIEWQEPSWLDGRSREPTAGAPQLDRRVPNHAEDWIDRLETGGPAEPETASGRVNSTLSTLAVEPLDRFELIWPSGEIDDEFGALEAVDGAGIGSPAPPQLPLHQDRFESPVERVPSPSPVVPVDASPSDGTANETDPAVLAVRRAVASIDVGSLAARRRLADGADASGRGVIEPSERPVGEEVLAPGRVAVRPGRNDWSRRTVTTSVFDEPAVVPAASSGSDGLPDVDADDEHRDRRAGALRRLITTLRR